MVDFLINFLYTKNTIKAIAKINIINDVKIKKNDDELLLFAPSSIKLLKVVAFVLEKNDMVSWFTKKFSVVVVVRLLLKIEVKVVVLGVEVEKKFSTEVNRSITESWTEAVVVVEKIDDILFLQM